MFELYSRRLKNQTGGPEIYSYDQFPFQFRVQLFYIVSDVFDRLERTYSRESWKYLHDSFARELGVRQLSRFYETYGQEKRGIEGFITEAPEVEVLDFIDFTFAIIENLMKKPDLIIKKDLTGSFEKAIQELNHRFRQHNLGYEFISGEIIRKDHELFHQEVIKPVLRFLLTAGFTAAEADLSRAFEHRRKEENKEAIQAALQAVENTLKAICARSGFVTGGAENTAEDLFAVLERNGFFPSGMKPHLHALRTCLESGAAIFSEAPEAAQDPILQSDEFTEYAINLAAANILLLSKICCSDPKPSSRSLPGWEEIAAAAESGWDL